MNSSFDYLYKFILIGDSNVGKSCLLNRFVEGRFKNQHDPTLGVQFGCKNITLEGLALKIQIWDTAGQQSFKSITRSYYKGSIAAFLVFDVTKKQSFENLNRWLYEIKNYSHEKVMIALVGNKIDLKTNRQISATQAERFAAQNKYYYFQTSALTGENVNAVFQQISKIILSKVKNKQLDPDSQNSYGIKIGSKKTQLRNGSTLNYNKSLRNKPLSSNTTCKC